MMIKHFKIKKLISAYQDGEVSPKEKAFVERHIEHCSDCKKYFEELQRTSSYLKEWRNEDVSIVLEQKVKKGLSENKVKVVKARHRNRLVPVAAGVGALAFLMLVVLSLSYLTTRRPFEVAEVSEEEIVERVIDFGDFSSMHLTVKAWDALLAKDYKKALAYAGECIKLYEEEAVFQQSQLTDFASKVFAFDYWALNDVAACYFIQGEVYREKGMFAKAKEIFQIIINQFSFAQCWDPKGWFWKVAEGAKDKLTTMGTGYDFGDHTSTTLTSKAWGALGAKDYYVVERYTNKCIDLFGKKALKQQAGLSGYPDTKADDNSNDILDVHENFWALNDVAICHFILGKALAEQGKQEEAQKHFKKIINDLKYAQCWDPQGWFWKVKLGAKNEIDRFTAKYDFGDYTSMTLAVKAWQALGSKDYPAVKAYTAKCFDLYRQEAEKQQAQLTDYASKENAFDYGALNDVGTCYFIRGETYMKQKLWDKAGKDFQTILDKYSYAQCWDPKGWFWKPVVSAQGRLNRIRVEKEMAAREKDERRKEEITIP
ncbi:MAG: zf-HC2 domain-containing protein [Candidatus Ratteibacteria bacterium]|nr:zf-HC2 domain-containing protein [Candidatus Ratteibacteria bacterium]